MGHETADLFNTPSYRSLVTYNFQQLLWLCPQDVPIALSFSAKMLTQKTRISSETQSLLKTAESETPRLYTECTKCMEECILK